MDEGANYAFLNRQLAIYIPKAFISTSFRHDGNEEKKGYTHQDYLQLDKAYISNRHRHHLFSLSCQISSGTADRGLGRGSTTPPDLFSH